MNAIVRLALAFAGVGLVLLLAPESAHAWTPGTHIYLGESILANLALLPPTVADLLRAYPFDFLYGNIAADSSIAKHYAPLGRHCHYWHVGQEIHDLADSDALRAFGLGYLCHLSADTVAHNYFVPRQLMLTSSTAAVGHSYWETRVESHLGDAYSKTAKDVILVDHSEADSHLDRIIAPTIFSVRTNRRLFRGMVHLTETTSWQRATQVAREYSRWRLRDEDVERHLGLSYDFMIELLGGPSPSAHQLDPSGRAAAQGGEAAPPEGAPRRRAAERFPPARRGAGAFRSPGPAACALVPDRGEAALGCARGCRAFAEGAGEEEDLNAEEAIRRMGLRPHPEGGFYRETFRSPAITASARRARPRRFDRHLLSPDRLAPTAPGIASRPTRSGTTTMAARCESTGWVSETVRLGRDNPQAVVQAGVWQAAEPDGEAVLVGCTVAPGFDFEDFALGEAEELLREFPEEEVLIRRLLRT